MEYDQGRRPRVTVVDPPLQRHDGQHLPHVFPGDDLCLYYDEFDGGQHLIADTVVPWISEWLFHYELWLIWLMPRSEPGPSLRVCARSAMPSAVCPSAPMTGTARQLGLPVLSDRARLSWLRAGRPPRKRRRTTSRVGEVMRCLPGRGPG